LFLDGSTPPGVPSLVLLEDVGDVPPPAGAGQCRLVSSARPGWRRFATDAAALRRRSAYAKTRSPFERRRRMARFTGCGDGLAAQAVALIRRA
jgi:hypothetical protein